MGPRRTKVQGRRSQSLILPLSLQNPWGGLQSSLVPHLSFPQIQSRPPPPRDHEHPFDPSLSHRLPRTGKTLRPVHPGIPSKTPSVDSAPRIRRVEVQAQVKYGRVRS